MTEREKRLIDICERMREDARQLVFDVSCPGDATPSDSVLCYANDILKDAERFATAAQLVIVTVAAEAAR